MLLLLQADQIAGFVVLQMKLVMSESKKRETCKRKHWTTTTTTTTRASHLLAFPVLSQQQQQRTLSVRVQFQVTFERFQRQSTNA